MPLFWLHTSLHSNLFLALPFANMNWVGFISFKCMLVAIVLYPFNVVNQVFESTELTPKVAESTELTPNRANSSFETIGVTSLVPNQAN